jgi:hypothetical protein
MKKSAPFWLIPADQIEVMLKRAEELISNEVEHMAMQIPDGVPMNTLGFGRGTLACSNENYPGCKRVVYYKAKRIQEVCLLSLILHRSKADIIDKGGNLIVKGGTGV